MIHLKCTGLIEDDSVIQILDDNHLIGEITPWEGGVRIVSPLLQNRMGLVMVEPQETPAIRIRLINPSVPNLKESARAMKFEEVVEGAVQLVYNTIFLEAKLTPGEERMAWAMVMTKLLQSMTMDLQSQMLKERMGLLTGRASGGSIIT